MLSKSQAVRTFYSSYPPLFSLIRIKQTSTLSYNCENQRTVFLVFQSKVCQYVQKQNYRSCSGCLYFSFVHYHVPVAFSVTISAHTHDIYLHRATSRLLLNIITESIFFTISSLDMVNHSGHYICSQSHSLCIQFCCIKVCTPHFEISVLVKSYLQLGRILFHCCSNLERPAYASAMSFLIVAIPLSSAQSN